MRRLRHAGVLIGTLVAAAACDSTTEPRVSPSALAFYTYRDGKLATYIMASDGSNPAPLIPPADGVIPGDWLPNGESILVSGSDVNDSQIERIDVATGARVRLTQGPAGSNGPVVSRDGLKIAYMRQGPPAPHLEIMNSNGSNSRMVPNTEGALPDNPTWSPDGGRLAFARQDVIQTGPGQFTYRTSLFVIDTAGRVLDRLVRGATPNELPATDDFSPSWSPDGTRIAYTSCLAQRCGISVVDVVSRRVTRLTDGSSDDEYPRWSPTGKRLAFDSRRAGGGHVDIFVMNADGSDLQNLTVRQSGSSGATLRYNVAPRWNPRARY